MTRLERLQHIVDVHRNDSDLSSLVDAIGFFAEETGGYSMPATADEMVDEEVVIFYQSGPALVVDTNAFKVREQRVENVG